MRPQSEIRVTLAAALLDGPGTTRQLAQRTGWSIGLTRMALDNMCKAGDARKGAPVRVAGVRRPVPVYHRAIRRADAAAANDAAPLISLIAAWVRPAAIAA
ncbi:hypothetical protein PEC18_05040 [Paucibacter sp. O1-1]|uniref:hypothetical protein n=1 Tax=Aquabacterium sp. OR-4 TaxID=2978127 RepID=UPI0021B1F99B|nr:hypothetical protein [Aquabacterium sp. OR-4]MCU7370250.1 hypothetical protein [Paucibacter sp. O1-1]MDA3825235.1 hypothetical protein [Paucibacter sp. O1-1]MDT7836475.1 hypothetical protein [Aquabacterium sp. OR-4]